MNKVNKKFNYEKYNELVNKISNLSDILKEQNEDNYMSPKSQDMLCKIIQEANRVNTYIRHYSNR